MPPVLERGRYVVVRTSGWLAWLIRRATRSPYNHVFLVTGDGTIIEATPRGVHAGQLSAYAGHLAAANILEPMTSAESEAVAAMAETLIGDGYNFPDLLAIGLADIGWHWRLLLRIAKADRLLICSQLVAECGAAAIPPMPWLCGRQDASQVTPADLASRAFVQPVTI